MKVAVTAYGPGLDAQFVAVFGRCPAFVLVDSETSASEVLENGAAGAAGGAGIQAAQAVIDGGAKAVITGNVGPNAFQVLSAAGIPVYVFAGGTVRQAVQAFAEGRLQAVSVATARAHAGMGYGRGGGMGPGAGMGRGGGRGRNR
ncbi:MAG: NifB/NifX family molybdenum-iron cluster-binding protein [Chloroflexi bacterium]|nr:NifB/NifX family molybdenum-iron cluster-binding protein [Chloroflexota bacterium]